MDKFATGLRDMLLDLDNPIKKFKKNTYEDMFHEYEELHKSVILEIESEILSSEDRQKCQEEIADMFATEIEKNLNDIKKKRDRENKLMDYNMSLVTYICPAFIDMNKETGKEFAEQIVLSWKKCFPKTNLKAASFDVINDGFKQRYCFITTAVCESLGKPDDCYELTLLRNYRDGYLAEQETGEELIKRYYDVAPTIVKHINSAPNNQEIYTNIWKKYLSPCVLAIENGENAACMKTYTNMVYDLQDKYFIQ